MNSFKDLVALLDSKDGKVLVKALDYHIRFSGNADFVLYLKSIASVLIPRVTQLLHKDKTIFYSITLLSILCGKGDELMKEIGKQAKSLTNTFKALRKKRDLLEKEIDIMLSLTKDPIKEEDQKKVINKYMNYLVIILANISGDKEVAENFFEEIETDKKEDKKELAKIGEEKEKGETLFSAIFEELIDQKEGCSQYLVNIIVNCTQIEEGRLFIKDITTPKKKNRFLKFMELLKNNNRTIQFGIINVIRNLLININDYRFAIVCDVTTKVLEYLIKEKDDKFIQNLLDIITILSMNGWCDMKIKDHKQFFIDLLKEKKEKKFAEKDNYITTLTNIVENLDIQEVVVKERIQEGEEEKKFVEM